MVNHITAWYVIEGSTFGYVRVSIIGKQWGVSLVCNRDEM